MKLITKKYLVGFLSIFLILSNFSFAATISICQMSMETKRCSCSDDNERSAQGPAISNTKKPCCLETTTELTNSNVLTALNNEILNLIETSLCSVDTFDTFILSFRSDRHFSLVQLKFLIPESDIPIETSSLLI